MTKKRKKKPKSIFDTTPERYIHQTKQTKTIQHKHPKRIKEVRETDYGDVILTETTTFPPETDVEIKDKLKNPKKVSFGYFGNVEFYAYPQIFPELVFMGKHERASPYHWRELFRIANKIRGEFGLKIGNRRKNRRKRG